MDWGIAICPHCEKEVIELPTFSCPHCGKREPFWIAQCPMCKGRIFKDHLPLDHCPHCDAQGWFLAYRPSDKQTIAHQSKELFLLYGGAMGGGKSVWIVNDALRDCLHYPGNRVGIFRWELAAFMQTTYVTLKEWVLDVPNLVVRHDKGERQIEFYNGSVILYGGLKSSATQASADPMSRLKSLEVSSAYIDEVTDVPKEWFDILFTRTGRWWVKHPKTGRRVKPQRKLWAASNPEAGWVKRTFVDEQLPDHRFVRSRLGDNPYVGEDYVEPLRGHLPEEWIQKYVEGDWGALADFCAVCPQPWLIAASNRRLRPSGVRAFGVDVASTGDDRTVIYFRKGGAGRVLKSIRGLNDTMKCVNLTAMLADRYHPNEIRVDAIGVGAGVADRLAEMGYPIVRVMSGERSNDPKKYLNRRAEMWWNFRRLLEEGKVSLPSNDPELLNELGTVKYLLTDKAIQIEKKELIKKRLGMSPDKADACIYCYEGAGNPYQIAGLVTA